MRRESRKRRGRWKLLLPHLQRESFSNSKRVLAEGSSLPPMMVMVAVMTIMTVMVEMKMMMVMVAMKAVKRSMTFTWLLAEGSALLPAGPKSA